MSIYIGMPYKYMPPSVYALQLNKMQADGNVYGYVIDSHATQR